MIAHYTGTLSATARPLTRQAYNDFRGWTLPSDEDGADAGYLVTNDSTGHVSWLPEEIGRAHV